MDNLVLYFDITIDSVIEEIMDYLIDNNIPVIESRVLFSQVKSVFIVAVDKDQFPNVFMLMFHDYYLTNKIIPKNCDLEDLCDM